jgi:hypothetical protein
VADNPSRGNEINARFVRLQQPKVSGRISSDGPLMQESTQGRRVTMKDRHRQGVQDEKDRCHH